ncbi:hypothetical protein BJX99DRAFT_234613 [Aspergillus californicus]
MAKSDSKPKDGTVTVNIEEFTKTRDTVLASLAQLQNATFELSRAYINHSNSILGQDTSADDLLSLTSSITASLRASGLIDAGAFASGANLDSGEKKKRKRGGKTDPNAPKRALTPFFLFMHHNRQAIAEELGGGSKPQDVSNEGTKRWAEMPEAQKEVWKKLYADNLAVYREKMEAYKAGLPFDHNDNDRAANQLHLDVAAVEGSDDEDEEEDNEEEEEEESSPEPVKEPTPPPPKRRRSEGKPSKDTTSPVVEKRGRNESPEKKKRGPASKKEEPTPRRTTKKKRKSDVGDDE